MTKLNCWIRMLAMFAFGAIVGGLIVFLRVDQYILDTQRKIKEKIEIIEKHNEEINEAIGEAVFYFTLMEHENKRQRDSTMLMIDPYDIDVKSRARLRSLKRLRTLSDKD